MPCDLKGVIHSTCFKFHSCSCYAMTHEILAYLDIPRCQKKSASNVSNFGSQSLWAPVCSKRIRFKKLMLSKPPFPPFIIAAMADIIIAICHIQELKKKLCITWKISPRNKKNPTERQNVFIYIHFLLHFLYIPTRLAELLSLSPQIFCSSHFWNIGWMHRWIMAAFIYKELRW